MFFQKKMESQAQIGNFCCFKPLNISPKHGIGKHYRNTWFFFLFLLYGEPENSILYPKIVFIGARKLFKASGRSFLPYSDSCGHDN